MQAKQEITKNPNTLFNKLPVVDSRDKAVRGIFILAIALMLMERFEIPYTKALILLATCALLGKYFFDRKQLATDFRNAAQKGDMAKLEELFKKLGREKIDAPSSNGKSALHWAARYKRNEAVSFLMRNGADINLKDYDGNTPVHDALFFPENVKKKTFSTVALMVSTKNFKGMFTENAPNELWYPHVKNKKNETAYDLLKKLEPEQDEHYSKAKKCFDTQIANKPMPSGDDSFQTPGYK